MRLIKIKLAGFKTFVEPTTLVLPGALVGIVGPNGCGKSTVIDAVRWVLGEMRASALRGEQMADVIFNGSDKRKPLAREEALAHAGPKRQVEAAGKHDDVQHAVGHARFLVLWF